LYKWDIHLDKSGFIAETVAAVGAHAVEVRLVLPVSAVRVLAVLVEPDWTDERTNERGGLSNALEAAAVGDVTTLPETDVAFRNGLVFKDAHAALETHLLGIGAHQIRRRRGSLGGSGSGRASGRSESGHRVAQQQARIGVDGLESGSEERRRGRAGGRRRRRK